ncbi:cytochrome P450 [Streptomyces sp. NPDC047028]|uniref:cytochrome P450 n=1 Tax=Streptomyces sp. NPDC047028 TaxID=3155793 RepID=UPI0033EA7366
MTPAMTGPDAPTHPIFADYTAADPRAALHAMTADAVSVEPRTGALIVTSYALVRDLLMHPALTNMPQHDPLVRAGLSDRQIALHRPVIEFFRAWGGHHAEVRRRLLPAFGRQQLQPVLPSLREVCAGLLRDLRERREPDDWIERFCRPYCLAVLASVFGSTLAQMDALAASTDGLMAYVAKPASHLDDDLAHQARASMARARDAVRETVLDTPRTLLAKALRSIADDPRLGEAVAVAVAVQIITGTMDPLAATLTEALLRRHTAPGTDRTADEPGYARNAEEYTEETLRLSCPFRFAVRYATAELDIAGHRVHTGQRVLLVLGSANLDEDFFPEPLAFRPGDRDNRHLAFGRGAHMCIGSQLARAAVTILTEALDGGDFRVEADPATLRRAGHLGADQITGLRVHVR